MCGRQLHTLSRTWPHPVVEGALVTPPSRSPTQSGFAQRTPCSINLLLELSCSPLQLCALTLSLVLWGMVAQAAQGQGALSSWSFLPVWWL